MVAFTDIDAAARRLAGVVHHTPLLTSRTLDSLTDCTCLLKAENFQRIGAFKIRGAYNKIASLTPEERARGVVAHSSGNHAQGVALASRLLGVRAVIVMPGNSPAVKVEATRAYGAEIVFCADSSDDRERVAHRIIEETHAVLVPPFNDEAIIAGQGTAILEVFRDSPQLDYLFVPIGGGGLIGGCSIAAKHLFPGIRVIGVETLPANDCQQSFRSGSIVKIPPPATIADGMRTQAVGTLNFEIIRRYVDDVITVTDEQVIGTMRFLLERMKIVAEPTGAVAPAAVYHNVLGLKGVRACAVISGGNVSREMLASVLA